MKKRTFKGKLAISKKTISRFTEDAMKGGGAGTLIECDPTNGGECTFGRCFSLGDGCSLWQVC